MKDWSDRPVVIVASGPSLTDADINSVRAAKHQQSIRIITVNDNWQLLPMADALYAADHGWWTYNFARVEQFFRGERWTCDNRIADHYPGVQLINSVVGFGLPETRDFIKVGASSTTQAVELAYIWGARTIGLLGVDCKAPAQKKHWFGSHPPCLDETLPFQRWIDELDILAKELTAEGVKVYNCSRDTALTCFPITTVQEFLRLHS